MHIFIAATLIFHLHFSFLIFFVPYGKPDDGHHQTADAERVAYLTRQVEGLFRDKEEGGADGGHEQGGNQRHPEQLLLTYQIDGQRPEGEHRECLVRPAEILPDGVESVGVLNLPDEHGDGTEEHGDTNVQTLHDGTLVEFQPFSNDETS